MQLASTADGLFRHGCGAAGHCCRQEGIYIYIVDAMVQAFVPPPADMPEFEYLRKGLADDEVYAEQMQPTFFKYK